MPADETLTQPTICLGGEWSGSHPSAAPRQVPRAGDRTIAEKAIFECPPGIIAIFFSFGYMIFFRTAICHKI